MPGEYGYFSMPKIFQANGTADSLLALAAFRQGHPLHQVFLVDAGVVSYQCFEE